MLKFKMQRKVDKATKRLSSQELKQREVTRNFNHMAKQVLTPLERETLHRSIRQYQKNRDVTKLHQMMVFILTTPEKQKLFSYVRSMMPEADQQLFDQISFSKEKVQRVVLTKSSKTKSNNFLHPSSAAKKTSFQRNIKVIMLNNKRDENLGISIRGGSEYGLGIYISQVDPLSPADYNGLEVGDEILEVNNINLSNVSLSGAVGVLTDSNKLKLVVNRMRKVPEWKKSKESTIWYDVRRKKLVPLPADERKMDTETIRERQVILYVFKPSDYIGMNIRGGNEYNLGIYVSKLDPGGLAEKNNVCIGDQIVAVNGTSFENVNHSSAVEFLRAHISLKLTLKAVGRYPAYKEVYQEYTWSENTGKPPNRPYNDTPDSRLVVSDTKINSRHTYLQNPNNRTANNHSHLGRNRLSAQQEVLLPRKHDISYSSPYDDAWTSSGFGDEEQNGSSETYANGHRSQRRQGESDLESDYVDSESDQDDYMAFLERKTKQENKSNPRTTTPNTHSSRLYTHNPEAITSFTLPRKQTSQDFTLKTYVLPDQHKTIYKSTPNMQATNPYLEYSQVYSKSRHSKNKGIVHVQEPKVQQWTNQQAVYSAPQKHSAKQIHKEDLHGPYDQMKSKSTPSLHTGLQSEIRVSSAYDSFDNYDHLHQNKLREPSVDYSLDGVKAIVSFSDSDHNDKVSPSHVYSSVEELRDKNNMDIYDAKLSDDEEDSTPSVDMRIKHLENRKSNLGSCEIGRMTGHGKKTPVPNPVTNNSNSKQNNGAWATLKKKLKGTEKGKKKKEEQEEAPMSLMKKRGMFETNFGSQMMNQHCVDNYNMMMLEEHTRSLLCDDECSAIIRHIKNYHETKDLDRLIDVLLQLLDTPVKLQLLKDIRGVIFPYHIALFDNKVNIYEIKEYERMSTKLHLPLNHNHKPTSRPQKTLMTTVVDDGGHFHIKTVDQHKRDLDHEIDVIKVMRSSLEVKSDSDSDSDSDGGKQQSYDLVSEDTRQDQTPSLMYNYDDSIIIYISKQRLHLGLILLGGEGNPPSPVRIDKILPTGAAADDTNIKAGMILLSIDDKSLKFMSRDQVLAALKKSYNNKRSVAMKLLLKHTDTR